MKRIGSCTPSRSKTRPIHVSTIRRNRTRAPCSSCVTPWRTAGVVPLLAAGSGLGKSLVVQSLLRQLGDMYTPRVHVVFPQMPADQLLAYLAESLTGDAPSALTPPIQHSVRRIEQMLAANVQAGRHAVIVIDDAQDLADTGALETIRLLLNFEHGATAAWTVLLVGQPSLLPVLDRMPELDERMAVKCLLRRLTLEESISYVHHRLQAAGARQEIFDNAALETVHHLALGVPRRINRLCDLALLIGFAEERTPPGQRADRGHRRGTRGRRSGIAVAAPPGSTSASLGRLYS